MRVVRRVPVRVRKQNPHRRRRQRQLPRPSALGQRSAGTDHIGQRRDIEISDFAGKDFALAVR